MNPVDELKYALGLKEDRELAAVFGKTPGAISNWRKGGLPASAELQAREMLQRREFTTTEQEYLSQQPDDVRVLVKALHGLTEDQLLELRLIVNKMKAAHARVQLIQS